MSLSESDIEALARHPKESAGDLDSRLTELRARGAKLLQCILYVKLNQGCSLAQARDIVVSSPAWIDQKEAFLRHQWDMFQEFLADNKDCIEAIHQTTTPDGTQMVVHMKTTGRAKGAGVEMNANQTEQGAPADGPNSSS